MKYWNFWMQVGLKLTAKAGFDIIKSPAVWDDFASKEIPCNAALSVLSTHPASAKRKQSLLREITSMKQRGWVLGGLVEGTFDTVDTRCDYFAA
jgi:predicted Zn-dependent protease